MVCVASGTGGGGLFVDIYNLALYKYVVNNTLAVSRYSFGSSKVV